MPDKYTLRPTDLGSPKDDFVFRFNGRDVGQTYADTPAHATVWCPIYSSKSAYIGCITCILAAGARPLCDQFAKEFLSKKRPCKTLAERYGFSASTIRSTVADYLRAVH